MKSDSKFIRLQLRYLHVGSRVIRRNGRLEEIQGVKSRLLDMIENLDESDPLLPVRSLKILADQERNVLILQGSENSCGCWRNWLNFGINQSRRLKSKPIFLKPTNLMRSSLEWNSVEEVNLKMEPSLRIQENLMRLDWPWVPRRRAKVWGLMPSWGFFSPREEGGSIASSGGDSK